MRMAWVYKVASKREVLDIAGRLDYERRMGRSRGLLHGIPILVKVCVEKKTKDFYQWRRLVF